MKFLVKPLKATEQEQETNYDLNFLIASVHFAAQIGGSCPAVALHINKNCLYTALVICPET